MERSKPDFSPFDCFQRFAGSISGDGSRIDGTWEIAEDHKTWEGLRFDLQSCLPEFRLLRLSPLDVVVYQLSLTLPGFPPRIVRERRGLRRRRVTESAQWKSYVEAQWISAQDSVTPPLPSADPRAA